MLPPTSGSQIPSGQEGDISYRQPRSWLLQPHFCGPKEAEGILEADNRPIPVKPVLAGSSTQGGNHQVGSGSDITRRLGSITGLSGRVSSRPHTSILPALSSILLQMSSIPVKAMPFWLASALLIFQSIVKAFVAPLHTLAKTSLLPRRLAPPQRLQRHSENTDEITHQECQIGRMDYEREEVGTDSLPGFHIHRDSLLHPCGTK
jgi:hypothetical protein